MKTKLYKRNQNNTIGFVEIVTRKVNNKKEYSITTNKGIVNSDKITTSKKTINLKNKTINEILDKLIVSYSNQGYDNDYNKVTTTNFNTFADNSIMPMLLNVADMDKLVFPCYIQRKYDGMRCISEIKDNGVHMKSRENNPINIEHLAFSIADIQNKQLRYPLDGEIYLHKKDLGDMISIYKNGDVNKQLSYVIYDIPDSQLTFEQRRNLLMAIDTEQYNNIQVDYGQEVNSQEEVLAFYHQALSDGYEGAVICNPKATYTPGYRTNAKQKIKPRETKEFKCIGHYFNKGKMAKQSTLICETEEKESFHVKMKGTSEQREQWAAEFEEKFLNKMITVEYRKITKYGKPIEAVGICVRDYE